MSPFPSTRVIHGRWSEHHQGASASGMTCRVRITIPGEGDGTFDESAGKTTTPNDQLLWDCPARIAAEFRARDADLAEQSTTTQRYDVAVPASVDAVPYAATVLVYEAPNDPSMVGRRLFVESTYFASERFERVMVCLETATPGTPATP
jgi:hypothetical protein